MPINSVLYIGESFAEVGLVANGSVTNARRIHLSREPLQKALTQYFTEFNQQPIDELLFAAKSLHATLRRRHGTAPAFLVTAGFENWLGLSRPIRQAHFTVQADRAQPLVEGDMIFGLSERISADGRIEKPVESADLEFLVSKLKLHNIEEVAVGLLHAQVNPTHEKLVGQFLKDQGFHVHLSSEVSRNGFEVARWLSAITNSYLGGDWKTQLTEIKAALQAGGHETATVKVVGAKEVLSAEDEKAPISSLFGPMLVLNKWRQKLSAQTLLYLGIEDFWIFDGRWSERELWRTEYGPIALPHVGFERCDVQSTQMVQKSFWGAPGISRQEGGFEPGPMSFGKSIMPQYFDILWKLDRLSNIEGLSDRFNDRAKSRIDESLIVMARHKGEAQAPNPQHLAQQLEKEAAARIAAQIPVGSTSVVLCGPLALALRPSLEPVLSGLGIKVHWEKDSVLSGLATLVEGAT